MDFFKEYQKLSRKTALYPNKNKNFIYPTLGLCGEVAEKIKKVLRDKRGRIDKKTKQEILKELGDVLYISGSIRSFLPYTTSSNTSYKLSFSFLL